jgi:uncharacterized membrane protein HdeD (DUF308 family)
VAGRWTDRQRGGRRRERSKGEKKMIGMLPQNWWAFVLRGVVAIALGILVFVQPNATLLALIAVFAA